MKKIYVFLLTAILLLCLASCNQKNYTHEIYRLDITARCISNNSVGNEWTKIFKYRGEVISSGERIKVPIDETNIITVNVRITEADKYSESASKDILITLKDKAVITEKITVIENNGKFKDNEAVWEIVISVKLVDRV